MEKAISGQVAETLQRLGTDWEAFYDKRLKETGDVGKALEETVHAAADIKDIESLGDRGPVAQPNTVGAVVGCLVAWALQKEVGIISPNLVGE